MERGARGRRKAAALERRRDLAAPPAAHCVGAAVVVRVVPLNPKIAPAASKTASGAMERGARGRRRAAALERRGDLAAPPAAHCVGAAVV